MGMPGCPMNLRYSGQMRSCCVTGRLVSARSNRRRVRVMYAWPSTNSRYLRRTVKIDDGGKD